MARRTRRKPDEQRGISLQSQVAAYGLNRWLPPAVIALAAIGMFCWSYGTWPDVIVDFGRELYVPWQLSSGQVLYRDIAHFNGPLSPYVNAAWFLICGASLRTLAFANFALLGLLVTLLYQLLARVSSRPAAFLACLFFVLVFGFSRYRTNGNYNYICPYSHEMTHGLLLSLAAIWFVGRFLDSGRSSTIAGSGLCVGLVFLTKPEIFLAVLPATCVGIGLALWVERAAGKRYASAFAAFLIAGAAPVLVAFALLALVMPAGEALLGIWGANRWMFDERITQLPFYRHSMGLYEWEQTFKYLLVTSFWYLVIFGGAVALGLLRTRSRRAEFITAAVCFAAVGAGFWIKFDDLPSLDLFRPLPFVILSALIVIGARCVQRRTAEEVRGFVMPITLLVFSLLLLAKVILFARIFHYGFVLAMPATMLLIVALWNWIPRGLTYLGGNGKTVQGATLAVLLALIAHLHLQTFNSKVVRVGEGADRFWADGRGFEVNRTLDDIARFVPPGATLAGAPEVSMLNFLTRHVNPTPYIAVMPVEVMMYGEDQILAAFAADPPDFFLYSTESTDSYGPQRFGDGYGEKLLAWVVKHYDLPEGSRYPVASPFRISLLKRRDKPLSAEPQSPQEDASPASR